MTPGYPPPEKPVTIAIDAVPPLGVSFGRWSVPEQAPQAFLQLAARQRAADALEDIVVDLATGEQPEAVQPVIEGLLRPALKMCIEVLRQQGEAEAIWRRNNGIFITAGGYIDASERVLRRTSGGGGLLEQVNGWSGLLSLVYQVGKDVLKGP